MVQIAVRNFDAEEREISICINRPDTDMTNRDFNNANRPLMTVVCFAAAIFLSACGGSGGGDGSRLDSTVPLSERQSNTGATNSGSGNGVGLDDAANPEDSRPAADVSVVDEDSTVDSSDTATSETGTVDSDSATPDDVQLGHEVSSTVVLRWSVPTERENGEFLRPEELGGYEIRYREVSESRFRTIPIEDALQEAHYFDESLSGEYEFQIATFDTNGLYSEFVNLKPYEEG